MHRFRLLVTGGGTGGHISPGLSVIEELRRRVSGLHVLWVGARGRREEDIVPRYDIPLVTMNIHGFRRSLAPTALFRNAKTLLPWLLGIPFWKALRIIDEFQPDFVLGTGGYVCVPMLIAARFRKIRSWILEQNSIPGLSVRMLSRMVDVVGVAYSSTARYLPRTASVELIGNPVSHRIITAQRSEGIKKFNLDPDGRTLLVIGGSLGSESLNRIVKELIMLHEQNGLLDGWQILHAVGINKYDAFLREVPPREGYFPHPFIYDMPEALAAADLVLCRAGAMTLAEVTARGLPSIIIPWPGAVRNHQYTNACELETAGAAIVLREKDASGIRIAELFRELRSNPSRLSDMAENARRIGHPDAARRLADYILAGDTR